MRRFAALFVAMLPLAVASADDAKADDGSAERPKEFKTTEGGSILAFKRVKE